MEKKCFRENLFKEEGDVMMLFRIIIRVFCVFCIQFIVPVIIRYIVNKW